MWKFISRVAFCVATELVALAIVDVFRDEKEEDTSSFIIIK
jgi:hypothetical protein